VGRSISVSEILRKNYKVYDLGEPWVSAFGQLSDPFHMMVFGKPKNGKTSFIMQFCKALAMAHIKVYYNSAEEGDSKTIQDAFVRVNMGEVPPGMFILGDNDSYSEMEAKLSRNRARVVVIDSRDYMKLTTEQWKRITRKYPRKSFILICWEQAGKPAGHYAKEIEFQVQGVVHVRQFVARCTGRWGPTEPYTIWKRTSLGQQSLFSHT
jgi:hypothetical protein